MLLRSWQLLGARAGDLTPGGRGGSFPSRARREGDHRAPLRRSTSEAEGRNRRTSGNTAWRNSPHRRSDSPSVRAGGSRPTLTVATYACPREHRTCRRRPGGEETVAKGPVVHWAGEQAYRPVGRDDLDGPAGVGRLHPEDLQRPHQRRADPIGRRRQQRRGGQFLRHVQPPRRPQRGDGDQQEGARHRVGCPSPPGRRGRGFPLEGHVFSPCFGSGFLPGRIPARRRQVQTVLGRYRGGSENPDASGRRGGYYAQGGGLWRPGRWDRPQRET